MAAVVAPGAGFAAAPGRPMVPTLLLPGKDTSPSSRDDSTSASRDGWTSPGDSSPRSEEMNMPTGGWTSPEWTPRGPEQIAPEPAVAADGAEGPGGCWSSQQAAASAAAGYWVPVNVQHGLIYQCVPMGAFWSAPAGCWMPSPVPMAPQPFPVMMAGPLPQPSEQQQPQQPSPQLPAWTEAQPESAGTPATPTGTSSEALTSTSSEAATDPGAVELTEQEEQLLEWLSQLPADELGQAAASLRGSVWRLAGAPRGTQMLQQVLLAAEIKDKAKLVKELKGHVNEAWESTSVAPHANYVLQKCIEVLPPQHCLFICDEMLEGCVTKAAHSKFGCRILQRLIEHFHDQDVAPLLDALLAEGNLQALMVSRFGNFVVQCILEHGPAQHKSRIAAALVGEEDKSFAKLAENKYASHVVQHAMKHCSCADRRQLVGKVLGVEAKEPKFKRSVYGSFVASEARKWSRANLQ